ncbi:MAG TPA: hypothetical protein VFA09_00935 [Ktedonobacteraceae bacterium]|nr:hypothetical protein [Ktedonobacteraceae bacterium]
MSRSLRKVIGGIILAILWVCCFLFIPKTLVIDFGVIGGVDETLNFKFTVIIIGLLVLFFYNLLYRSSAEATKLSWTSIFTIAWLSLIIFYPFTDPNTDSGDRGAVAFFTLIAGLAVCVLWVRFFSDEISLE